MTDDVIEGEVVGSELALREGSTQLVMASDPAEFIAKSTEIATALAAVVKTKGLSKRIGTREYVFLEGWTLLGSMLGAFGQGVYAVEDWTREYKDPETGKVIGWEARVVAKTLEGAEVGAAEAMCTRKETSWKGRDDYALRSMAQTRASAKALRMPLGFIMQLAGYAATPKEEIDEEQPPQAQRQSGPTHDVNAAPPPDARPRFEKGLEALAGQPGWSLQEVLATASALWGRTIETPEQLTETELNEIIKSMNSFGKAGV